MWKAAVLAFLLLHTNMQANGAMDKKSGSATGRSEPDNDVQTDEAKASHTILPSEASSSAFSGNLLVVPMDGSHWVTIKAIAQELGRRGHRVTAVIPEVNIRMGPGKHYDTVTYPVPYNQSYVNNVLSANKEVLQKSTQHFTEKIWKKITQIQRITGFIHTTAESLLFNASLISHLAQQVSPNTEAETRHLDQQAKTTFWPESCIR